jgi:hypothetical protein
MKTATIEFRTIPRQVDGAIRKIPGYMIVSDGRDVLTAPVLSEFGGKTKAEYVGRRLWVGHRRAALVGDGRLVRVFNDRWQQVAVHAKAEPGRFRTAAEHIPKEKISAVERGTNALLRQVAAIGPQTRQWSEAMTQARGVEGVRVLVGLKALAGKYDAKSLENACEIALSHGAYRLRSVRQLLKRRAPKQQQFEFLKEHPIIRPLSDYSLQSLLEFRKERTHGKRHVV